jgi:hypothetical protein
MEETKCECGANVSCECGPEEVVKDLEYWKLNAEEDYLHTPISVLRYISELEKVSNEENLKKRLSKLDLVNPAHLQMTSNGHGEFPDGYKLTDKGVQYIIDKLRKNENN